MVVLELKQLNRESKGLRNDRHQVQTSVAIPPHWLNLGTYVCFELVSYTF